MWCHQLELAASEQKQDFAQAAIRGSYKTTQFYSKTETPRYHPEWKSG